MPGLSISYMGGGNDRQKTAAFLWFDDQVNPLPATLVGSSLGLVDEEKTVRV
jgi:hypothetical protein